MKTQIKIVICIFALWLLSPNVFAQVDVSGSPGHTWVSGYYVGWASNNSLEFKIGTVPALLMSLSSAGNLDLTVPTRGYQIGGATVLSHGGNNSNIYLGVFAGNATIPSAGSLTYLGSYAGNWSTATAQDNTFVGNNSGYQNTDGQFNTYVGSKSGNVNNTGNNNVCVGGYSGLYNTVSNNTFVGFSSGYNSAIGDENSFFGINSGITNQLGSKNTIIGANADCAYNLVNASAFGAYAIVNNDDQMILGGDFTIGLVHHSTFVGIGLSGSLNGGLGPQNSLEINADPFRSANTATGLRFTQVTSSNNINSFSQPFNQTTIAPWGKVLTVDVNGEVGLTDDLGTVTATNAAWINASGDVEWGTNRLLHDTEVPMVDGHTGDEWSIYFSGQSSMTNPTILGGFDPVDIGIGYTMTSPLRAKLDVWNLTATTANASFTNQFAGRFSQTGSYTDPTGTVDFIGVYANSVVTHTINTSNNIGGDFLATFSPGFNIGARGTAAGTSRLNVGLWGTTIPGGPVSIGVYGVCNIGNPLIAPGTINYAVFGDLVNFVCTNPAPFCTFIPNAAGYFNGDVISTTGVFQPSDANLKQNIQDLSNPMDFISQLQPKSYTFDQLQNESMVLPSGTHYGLFAQDVYNVLPQLTKDCVHPARYDSLGNEIHAPINFKAINYTELIPFLIAGMKQQQEQITNLENLLEELNQLPIQQNPDGDNGEGGNGIDVILSSRTIVLNQNVPNPFKENTTIEYFIPDDATNVKIIFTDNKGSVLKEVEIAEKGIGQLNVYASDLSSGIYTYTIVANGITIDSKRMVKTK